MLLFTGSGFMDVCKFPVKCYEMFIATYFILSAPKTGRHLRAVIAAQLDYNIDASNIYISNMYRVTSFLLPVSIQCRHYFSKWF